MNDEPRQDTLTPLATDDASLLEDMRALASEARALAAAELAYQKARAKYAGRKTIAIVILGVSGACFVFFAVMAAIFGTVIALGPILTLWGAMAAVSGGLMILVLICLFLVSLLTRQMKEVITEKALNSEKDGDGKAG